MTVRDCGIPPKPVSRTAPAGRRCDATGSDHHNTERAHLHLHRVNTTVRCLEITLTEETVIVIGLPENEVESVIQYIV